MSFKKRLGKWGMLRPWSTRELVPVALGAIWMSIGSSYCMDEWSARTADALAMPLAIMPQQGWGLVFIFCGALAIASSRWPPHQDTWGYVVIGVCSMWWGCAYLVGALANGGRSWSSAAVWLVVCLLIYVVNLALEPSKKGV